MEDNTSNDMTTMTFYYSLLTAMSIHHAKNIL